MPTEATSANAATQIMAACSRAETETSPVRAYFRRRRSLRMTLTFYATGRGRPALSMSAIIRAFRLKSGCNPRRATIFARNREKDGAEAVVTRILAVIFAVTLSSCGVNYHVRPKGACPTAGVSPLASNCPTPEELRGK